MSLSTVQTTFADKASEAVGGPDRGATIGAASDAARRRLEHHEAIWRARPLLRDIYHRYYEKIDRARSSVPGPDVEIGAGHGNFASYRPATVTCDVIPCPWLDCAADAAHLPFRDACLANIVMIDVLHHVADTVGFLSEAARTLAPGGRLVMLEPYTSPISWIAWRYFHDERIDMRARPLDPGGVDPTLAADDPWDANTAIPTLVFWRDRTKFESLFPSLRLAHRERFDLLLYPSSGGFERRRLVPMPLVPIVGMIERAMAPLAPLMAFRCLVVAEKRASCHPRASSIQA